MHTHTQRAARHFNAHYACAAAAKAAPWSAAGIQFSSAGMQSHGTQWRVVPASRSAAHRLDSKPMNTCRNHCVKGGETRMSSSFAKQLLPPTCAFILSKHVYQAPRHMLCMDTPPAPLCKRCVPTMHCCIQRKELGAASLLPRCKCQLLYIRSLRRMHTAMHPAATHIPQNLSQPTHVLHNHVHQACCEHSSRAQHAAATARL